MLNLLIKDSIHKSALVIILAIAVSIVIFFHGSTQAGADSGPMTGEQASKKCQDQYGGYISHKLSSFSVGDDGVCYDNHNATCYSQDGDFLWIVGTVGAVEDRMCGEEELIPAS